MQGGGRPASRRAAAVVVAVGALLLAQPAWHALAPPGSSSPRTAGVRTPGPLLPDPGPAPPVTSRPGPVDDAGPGDPPPVTRRGVAALLRWHRRLPVALSVPPRRPLAGEVFRVVPGVRDAGADGPDQVGQARVGAGWTDVEHGDLGPAVLDATGGHLAVMVRRRDPSGPVVRQWLDVVTLADPLAVTSTRVTVESAVLGWFGPYVVVQPRGGAASGRELQLIDRTGRPTHRVTASVSDDGHADVALHAGGADGCASVAGLGLATRRGVEICPDDELLALAPDGSWGVTRDLRWVDVGAGISRPFAGRPPGQSARAAEVVADGKVLLRFTAGRRTLTALCSRDGTCARLP